MFVGCNHHLQCTVFGFTLLGDENVDTFEWVFNAFKTCMGPEGPRVILTGMINKLINYYVLLSMDWMQL
jgi:hypothetical protein